MHSSQVDKHGDALVNERNEKNYILIARRLPKEENLNLKSKCSHPCIILCYFPRKGKYNK